MRSTLYKILVFHILILLFQLAFRQLILDTTFVRDIGLFLMCAVYVTGKKGTVINSGMLGKYVTVYLWYGVLMSLFHLLDGTSILDVILTYRNHFFPFVLFFFAFYIFQDIKYRKKWVDLLYVVFLILLVDVYLEAIMDVVGISRGILPWYKYQFAHYYRFTDDDAGARIVTNPEYSPILGLLGWNNPTACALTGLLSFFIPFFMYPKKNEKELPRVMRISNIRKICIVILTLVALVILEIKTAFIAFAVVWIVFNCFSGKDSRGLRVKVTILTVLVAILALPLWINIFTALREETMGESGFEYIFNIDLFRYFFSITFGNSPLAFLFGTDISKNSMFELMEVRIIVHTIQFGVIWLFIICSLILSSYKTFKKINVRNISALNKLTAMGSFLLIVNYVVDFMHYAHVMFMFHMDIFAVTLALIAVINQVKLEK